LWPTEVQNKYPPATEESDAVSNVYLRKLEEGFENEQLQSPLCNPIIYDNEYRNKDILHIP
jgi:hypothetical protein